jgi:GntR family transcriptional regulator
MVVEGDCRGMARQQRRLGLDREDGVPLHRKLFLVLRSGIYSGRYRDGDAFPTEEALVREFQVSRTTVRRALSSLEGEGLIVRSQGANTKVAADVSNYAFESSLSDHRRMIEEISQRTTAGPMEIDHVVPPEGVRAALRLGADETVTRIRRLRMIKGVPVWHTTAYLPAAVSIRIDRNTNVANLDELLEASGIRLGEVDETIGAILADPVTAANLDVAIGAPLLETITLTISDAGDPVSLRITVTPPERHRIRLARRSDTGTLEKRSES